MLKRLLLTLSCTLLLLPVLAETPLTLRECIEQALTQETSVLVGQTGVASAQAKVTKAKSGAYPQVGVSETSVLLDSGAPLGQRSGTTLTVSQNIYDGGVRAASVRGTKATVGQQTALLERTKQTVAYNVTNAYFAVLRAQHLAEVQTTRNRYLEGYRTLVQARVDAGDAAQVDLLPVEAQLANARVDLLAANHAVRTAAVALQHAMGLAPRANFAIQDISSVPDLPTPTLDDGVKAALTVRPDITSTRYAVAAAAANTSSAKIALRPRLVVNGEYSQPMFSGDPSGTAITGGIAYNLFDGGGNRAAYHDAQAAQTATELRAAQVEKDIRADVETALLNLDDARQRYAASTISLQAAQKNFEAQEGRYKQGLAIPLDLLNAQVDVATAQSNTVQARYDVYTSYAQLEYAIGKQGGLYAN